MYKVLIVDDEIEMLNGLKQYFPWNDLGFHIVHTATSGKEALNYIYKEYIDVMICDIRMPIMSGLQLAKEVTEQFPNVYIVLLSAYKDFEYAREALQYNVKKYILKPIHYEKMKNLLCKIKKDLDNGNPVKGQAEDLSYSDRMVITLKRYIENNLGDVSLEGLADIADMNPQYMSKYFREKVGVNFSDYVLEMRMEKALILLNDIRYRIFEVGLMIGYKSPKNFTRAFKRYYGITPSEYRTKHKNRN